MSRSTRPSEAQSRLQRLHERTSYGILPTPPSPSNSGSCPSLTQSGSNLSTSPTQPSTPPPRNTRLRQRYPDLGRVPLHRRGTSTKYENLEDLLREAGYKETRIFTPESERVEAAKESADSGENMNRGSSLLGFLAGLVPRPLSRSGTNNSPIADELEEQYLPPSPSPIPRRSFHQERPRSSYQRPLSPAASFSSLEGMTATPRVGARTPAVFVRSPSYHGLAQSPDASQTSLLRHQESPPARFSNNPHTSSPLCPHSPSLLPPSPLRRQSYSPRDRPKHQPIFQPRPSRAGEYLRHMASLPDVKRPRSTPTATSTSAGFPRRSQNQRQFFLKHDDEDDQSMFGGNGEGEEDPPPMPSTWLETVAKAVMFGGFVGGPRVQTESSDATPALRHTRSVLARDRAHSRRRSENVVVITRGRSRGPPELLTQAKRSDSIVSHTRVVCRSTPASRANSLVRGEEKSRKRNKKRDSFHGHELPSLAKTRVEGDDDWDLRGRRNFASPNHARIWDADDSCDESSEGEGELDLAKMLVPPKRQNSIRSLRRNLGSFSNINAIPSSSSAHVYSSGNSRTFRRWNREREWEEEDEREFLGFLDDSLKQQQTRPSVGDTWTGDDAES